MEESRKQREARQKEEDLDRLIDEMAEVLIAENKRTVGEDIADKAIEKIKDDRKKKTEEKKGGDNNEQKTKTRRIRRTTK